MGGVFVDLLSEHVVCDTEEVMKLIQEGARLRATSKTRMNKVMNCQLCISVPMTTYVHLQCILNL